MQLNVLLLAGMVPNKIWRKLAFKFLQLLTDIYNALLRQGYVLDQLKQSLIRPLPKCYLAKVENDVRPITLTCQVPKIMEGFT